MAGFIKGTFAALAVRPFRILWLGSVLAFVGFFMSTVVQSVVAFDLTGENRAVGLVTFAQGLMMFTFAPLGGALSDRLPKRRVIAICQLATMASFFAISWAIATGRIQMMYLVVGSLIMGASFAFLGPARQSLAVELVGEKLRGNAVALTQIANNGCRVLGPALGGAFLAWFSDGAAIAYVVMGLFYLSSILSLILLPKSKVREGARNQHVLADMLDGMRYVRDHRKLRRLMLLFTLVIMIGFPHVTLLPGLVENELGTPAAQSGTLWAVSAFGALAASLVVARKADSDNAPKLFSRLALGFGAALVVTATSPSFSTIVLLMVFVGALSGSFQVLGGAVIVRFTEPRYVGRVMSLTMLSFAGFGLVGLPIGLLADAVGERATFATLGAAVCLIALAFRPPSPDPISPPQPSLP